MAWRYGSAVPNASDHILEMPISYRVWQAPFAEAKFAPVLAHNDLSAVRRVLDVGCGPGTNAAHFAGSDYVGIDLNPRYIEDAKRRHGRDFRVADAAEVLGPGGVSGSTSSSSTASSTTSPTSRPGSCSGTCRRALAPDGHIHVMELVLPPRPCMGRLLARLDRGDFARPLESWRELLGEHFDAVVFEPYPLGAAWSELTTLWHMVYFKGAGA